MDSDDRRIRTVLVNATDRIKEAVHNRPPGSGETPFLDALLLLCETTGLSKERLLASYSDEIDGAHLDTFFAAVDRRCAGEPVSYILGRKEFYGREFAVGPGVLVPRPDTEIVVECALTVIDQISTRARERPLQIHDCCTGSGCIAVTIACERDVVMSASDISADALAYARENAARHGVEIDFFHSDLLNAREIGGRELQIITANPPYVADNEVDELRNAGWPEPLLALAGGTDGLDQVRKLVTQAAGCLATGGWLMVEIGSGQGPAAKDVFESAGFTDTELVHDLAGRHRVCRGRWYRR